MSHHTSIQVLFIAVVSFEQKLQTEERENYFWWLYKGNNLHVFTHIGNIAYTEKRRLQFVSFSERLIRDSIILCISAEVSLHT